MLVFEHIFTSYCQLLGLGFIIAGYHGTNSQLEVAMTTMIQKPNALEDVVVESPFSVLHINGAVVVRSREADTTPLDVKRPTEREIEVLSLVD